MTNEQAIKWLKALEANEILFAAKEALNMAIQALEQNSCKTCKHRDPEDKKCDCGGLERQGCLFPVSDDYYCKYYERGENMDIVDFNKMTEEIEEVANKYGLTVDFGKGTIGEETEISLKLRNKESTFDDYLKEQLKDPEFKKEWDKLRDEEMKGGVK